MNYSFFIENGMAAKAAVDFFNEDARAARLSRMLRTYYRLRPLIPVALRQALWRKRNVEAHGPWYLPDAFLKTLVQSIEKTDGGRLRIVYPWPRDAEFAFVLTHDVDTKEGVQQLANVAEIEEELGFRSCWNFVPYKYQVDQGLLRDLQSRSFEIGIHGYNHDGRLYSSRKTFERRAVAINGALREFGAVGFRSPMVHRNLDWLQLLNIEYDASCFDVDPFQPMPGGVGSIWPFVAGKFVELPYTLPQDHTLFIALGKEDLGIWQNKLAFLIRNRGMALMLTHPDYLVSKKHLDLYRQFLISVREKGGYWHALPRDVTQWWRDRESSTVQEDGHGYWRIEGPASEKGALGTVEVHDGELMIVTDPPRTPIVNAGRGPLRPPKTA